MKIRLSRKIRASIKSKAVENVNRRKISSKRQRKSIYEDIRNVRIWNTKKYDEENIKDICPQIHK